MRCSAVAGVMEPTLCRFLPDEIEALTRLGELGMAEALLDPFEARSAQLDRKWGLAAAGRCRGLLLAARGDLAGAARQRWKSSTPRCSIGCLTSAPFEEARTLLAAGEVQRRAAAQAQRPYLPGGRTDDLRAARRPGVAAARRSTNSSA